MVLLWLFWALWSLWQGEGQENISRTAERTHWGESQGRRAGDFREGQGMLLAALLAKPQKPRN